MTKMSMSERIDAAMAKRMHPGVEDGGLEYELQRNISVPMPDGVTLLGDLRTPVGEIDPRTPTVLIRSPYGRRGFIASGGIALATHGFPVFIQSCRGTFGSGGTFRPQLDDQADGIATHRWVREQPWFTGRLATYGASYLGYVQWAVAGKLAREEPDIAPDAMALSVTMPDFGKITWDNGAYSLRNALGWTRMVSHQEGRGRIFDMLVKAPRDNKRGFQALPLSDGDRVSVGRTVDWYQDWVRHEDLRDEYWAVQSHTASVADVTAPVSMVTGWDDIFLPWMMRDYAVLAGKGRAPELTIGPWSHATSEQMATSTNEAIAFLGRQFLDRPAREAPVRIFLRGEEQWHDLPSWPPPGTAPQAFYLQPTGGLGTALPLGSAAPTRYRYDPADPTPAVGGPSLEPKPVPRDNTEVERRGDVITFTGEALKEAIDVTGEPIATIAVRSDRPSFDLFVRICDVGPDGISMTVCDGIRRVGSIGTLHTDPPADDTGVRSVEIPLWPTAHRFLAGHRIRIQISSGAHPRYARNPGSGEPGATATELHVATQEIFHDAEHTSSVLLPIWHH